MAGKNLNPGDLIRVRAFGGVVIERRVVGVKDSTVYICKDQEYLEAKAQSRTAVCVGFPLSSIVAESKSPDGRGSSK